jgi:hypothetical protein
MKEQPGHALFSLVGLRLDGYIPSQGGGAPQGLRSALFDSGYAAFNLDLGFSRGIGTAKGPRKMLNYYTLITFSTEKKKWSPQFGDFEFAVVKQEEEDSYQDVPKAQRKILRTDSTQTAIDKRISYFNNLV